MKSPDTERFTFEAVILLSLLANFHKSDAAKLNPYLLHIQTTTDMEFMRKLCWATNFACDTAVRCVPILEYPEQFLNGYVGHSKK